MSAYPIPTGPGAPLAAVLLILAVAMFVAPSTDAQQPCGGPGEPTCAAAFCADTSRFGITMHWRTANDPHGGDYLRCQLGPPTNCRLVGIGCRETPLGERCDDYVEECDRAPIPSDCKWVAEWYPIPERIPNCPGLRQRLHQMRCPAIGVKFCQEVMR
jgi:hypothetical protein